MGIRQRITRHRRIAIGAVMGFGGIAAACVPLVGSPSASGQRLEASRQGIRLSTSAVAPSLLQDFSVLRGASIGLPVSAQASWSAPGGMAEQEGLNLSATRSSEVDGLTISIVPGASNVCEYIRPTGGAEATPSWWGEKWPVGGCGSVTNAIKGEAMLWHQSATGEVTIVGIVPDGNSSVRVTGSVATPMTVPVVKNVYVARLQDPALRLETAVEVHGPNKGAVENIAATG